MNVEVVNAIIKSVEIGDDDHGSLTAWLHLDYGDSQQGFGGYTLFNDLQHEARKPNYMGYFVNRCLEIGGVRKWASLAGKVIRVKKTHHDIKEIGHVVDDIWFNPGKELTELHEG